ncbi:RNA polymerase subunit sigma-24, partial [Streptomyces albidoflavus]
MYPHVGVDASGLATLRATVVDRLRSFVPTVYARRRSRGGRGRRPSSASSPRAGPA